MPILTWFWAATAFAGKRALRKAALGVVALPGGVVVESGAAFGLPAAGELGEPGVVTMQAAHAVAKGCFAAHEGVDPLSGEPTGWQVVVDVAPGSEGHVGVPLVDGLVLEGGELDCLAEGLAAAEVPVLAGMTLRIASPGPLPIVGDARVTLDRVDRTGDGPASRRALRFERRAAEIALACARRVGAPASGTYPGVGLDLVGVDEPFAACWAEHAPALEAWTDDPASARWLLRFTRP